MGVCFCRSHSNSLPHTHTLVRMYVHTLFLFISFYFIFTCTSKHTNTYTYFTYYQLLMRESKAKLACSLSLIIAGPAAMTELDDEASVYSLGLSLTTGDGGSVNGSVGGRSQTESIGILHICIFRSHSLFSSFLPSFLVFVTFHLSNHACFLLSYLYYILHSYG